MWSDAWAYDLATGAFIDDVHFWEGVISELRPRRVLELACGTDRLSFPSPTAGLAVQLGFPARRPRFQRFHFSTAARRDFATSEARLNASVRFVEGDMANFDFGERFDLILLPYNSFCYLEQYEDRRDALTCIRRHMDTGGRFAIDVAAPRFSLLSARPTPPSRRCAHQLEWTDPAPGHFKRFVSFFKSTGLTSPRKSETQLTTGKSISTTAEAVSRQRAYVGITSSRKSWRVFFGRRT